MPVKSPGVNELRSRTGLQGLVFSCNSEDFKAESVLFNLPSPSPNLAAVSEGSTLSVFHLALCSLVLQFLDSLSISFWLQILQ